MLNFIVIKCIICYNTIVKKETKKSIIKLVIVVLALIGFFVLAFYVLKWIGLDSVSKIVEVCNKNAWGALIFIALQIMQVLFIPVGNMAFTVPGAIIFGATKGFFITWAGVTIGSIIMFYIGRYGGGKLLNWIVGREKAEHYRDIISKGKFILPFILLIPVFPDDIVCASAGLSKIKWWYFWITIFITRGIDTFCTCFIAVESAKSPVGIAFLCIFIVCMLIAAYFVTKYREKIENFFVNLFTRKKQKLLFEKDEPVNVYSNDYVEFVANLALDEEECDCYEQDKKFNKK